MDWELNLPFDYPSPAEGVNRSISNPLTSGQLNDLSSGIRDSIQLPDFNLQVGEGNVVSFQGTIQQDKYWVLNPDPTTNWDSFYGGGTVTSEQNLATIYVPSGHILRCIGDTYNYEKPLIPGVPERGGSTYYQFFMFDPEGNRSLVYPLANYTNLKLFSWVARPSYWQGKGEIQLNFTVQTVNIRSVVPRPTPTEQIPPPPPPPSIPPPPSDPPPPDPPPPCDIPITVDPQFRDTVLPYLVC